MKRSNKEILILTLSAFAAVAISPFAVIRFYQNEMVIAVTDLIIGIGMSMICIYVYKTRKILLPSMALAIFSSVAAIASIYIRGESNVYWAYPTIVAAYYLLSPKSAIVLTLLTVSVIIPKIYIHLEIFEFITVLTTIFMTSLFGYIFSTSVEKQHLQLTEMATIDSLTGVGNRRAMDSRLATLISSQVRNPSTASIILLDLDYFKSINDDLGHIIGDQILIRVAEIVGGRIRVTDALYRFGGEEFVIVLQDLDLEKAEKLAEQLRILIENNELASGKSVTISLGVAEYQQDETKEAWLSRADEALYNAKNSGRNKVCIAARQASDKASTDKELL